MPHALWRFPFLCWILQDQDPPNLVCYWFLYYALVLFYAMLKELNKHAKMKEFT